MQFNLSGLALALAIFIAAAECAPAQSSPTSLNPAAVLKGRASDLAKRINDCDDSTFENQTSGGSPSTLDCQRLANDIAGDNTWVILPGVQKTLHTFGSCAFGVDNLGGGLIYVGNDDIRDLIHDSISRFEWNGLVGAKGNMYCQSSAGVRPQYMEWGIYHT